MPVAPSAATANLAPSPTAPRAGATTGATDINIDRSTVQQRYYAAVAAYVQPALVTVRGTDARQAGAEAVHVAIRRSPKGALLLALFNTSDRPAAVAPAIEGVAGVALDLATERELTASSRGLPSRAKRWTTSALHGACRPVCSNHRAQTEA
jgi:hypothetical protein